jgi:hypothetical protein
MRLLITREPHTSRDLRAKYRLRLTELQISMEAGGSAPPMRRLYYVVACSGSSGGWQARQKRGVPFRGPHKKKRMWVTPLSRGAAGGMKSVLSDNGHLYQKFGEAPFKES